MKFVRFGTKVLNISAIAHVDMHWPDEDTTDDCVRLAVFFIGGGSTLLNGDQAIAAWKLLERNSVGYKLPQLAQAS